MVRNSGDIDVVRKGTVIWYHAKYQLAPAVTKNAPDKNLHDSFQTLLGVNIYLLYCLKVHKISAALFGSTYVARPVGDATTFCLMYMYRLSD